MARSRKKKAHDLKQKIKGLVQKIRKLEGEEKDKASKGVAVSILEGIGDIIPGLGGLIRELEKSQAFQERLRAIEEKVDARLTGPPPKHVERERRRFPGPPGSIPRRTVVRRPYVRKGGEGIRVKPEGPKDVAVDLFDEGDHLKVIGELPGLEEKDIRVELKDDKILISADTSRRKYHKEVSLPCRVKVDLKTGYKNGVLEIRLEKEGQS